MSEDARGDLGAAVQMLAADNARLCDILIAAEKLADAVAEYLHDLHWTKERRLKAALQAFRIVRQGQ